MSNVIQPCCSNCSLFVFLMLDTLHPAPLPDAVLVALGNLSHHIVLVEVRIVFPTLRLGSHATVWFSTLVGIDVTVSIPFFVTLLFSYHNI